MADALVAVTAFLAQEKVRAEERIRMCQIFLLDPELEEAVETGHVDVKADLERMRQNAEDDFGTVLHLLTVLRSRAQARVQAQPGGGAGAGGAGDAVAVNVNVDQASSRSVMPKSDKSPLGKDMEDDLDPLMEETLFDVIGVRGRVATKSPAMDDLDEEDDDEIERIGRDVAEDDDPMVSGRFIGLRAPTANRSNVSLARSLPISVPLPERPGFDLAALPELEHDDESGQVDIASSIQMIAKSLHTNALGELPPSRMKRFNAE